MKGCASDLRRVHPRLSIDRVCARTYTLSRFPGFPGFRTSELAWPFARPSDDAEDPPRRRLRRSAGPRHSAPFEKELFAPVPRAERAARPHDRASSATSKKGNL